MSSKLDLAAYLGPYIDLSADKVVDCPHLYLPGGSPQLRNAHSRAVLPHKQLVTIFNRVRHIHGEALLITSGARCPFCQDQVRAEKAARGAGRNQAAKVSEHTPVPTASPDPGAPWEFTAFDLQPSRWSTKEELEDKLAAIARLAGEVDPDVRIGRAAYRSYARPIIHLGVGYLLDPNPDPVNWKRGMRW